MTDKKPTETRRPVALPRLHKAIEDFCGEYALDGNNSIEELLNSIRDAWFADSKK